MDPLRALQRVSLTATHIMDMRLSMPHRGSSDGSRLGVPFMVYSPSEDAFILHNDGAVWALHRDPRVIAQMMACERAEPGFIRRVLSTAEPCDVASLSPDERAAHVAQARTEHLKRLAYEQDQREAVARRAAALNPTPLTLDDI